MIRRVLLRLREELAEGRAAVMVSVVDWQGSVPRKDRPRMAFFEDGKVAGTVGGGRIDRRAGEMAASCAGEPLREEILLDAEAGSEGELACGGRVTLEAQRFAPADLARVDELLADPALEPPRLLVFGGGHVGLAASRLAAEAGWAVHVVDDRPDYSDPARFPFAADTASGPPEAAARWEPVAEKDALLIATRGHRQDEEALAWAMRTSAGYIGMLSSTRKKAKLLASLEAAGAPVSSLEGRFHSPVGLSIGAETVEEIAVAIVAELISWRRSR